MPLYKMLVKFINIHSKYIYIIPRFFGLPKIHKDGLPARRIVSYTGTPLYEVSKYIAEMLKPNGKQKEQHTNNSKSFSTFIRQQTIEPDEIMVTIF